MKKSVIILIGIIYIASIFVVGFFGMQVKNYNVMVYIEDIECTNEGIRTETNGNKTLKFKYIKNDPETGDPLTEDQKLLMNSVILTYELFPKNTTLKGKDAVMAFPDEQKVINGRVGEVDPAEYTRYTVAVVDDLTISFVKPGVLIVDLKSMDGSNITETVKIIAY